MADDQQFGLYQLRPEERLRQLEKKRKGYLSVLKTLDEFPRRRTVSGMLPLGPLAIVPGKVVHTNEVMVLLGDNYFAEVSAYDAIQIAQRRLDRVDAQIMELNNPGDLLQRRKSVTFDEEQLLSKGLVPTAEEPAASSRVGPAKTSAGPPADRKPKPSLKQPSSKRQPNSREPAQRNEQIEMLGRLAAGIAAGQEVLSNEDHENMVLLTEEYADEVSKKPISVTGLPEGAVSEDINYEDEAEEETTSDEEEREMRSLEEEMNLLEQLANDELRLESQPTRKLPSLKRGFLLEEKQKREKRESRQNIPPQKVLPDVSVSRRPEVVKPPPAPSQVLTSTANLEAEDEDPGFSSEIIFHNSPEASQQTSAPAIQTVNPSNQESLWEPPEEPEPAPEKKSLFKQRMEARRQR